MTILLQCRQLAIRHWDTALLISSGVIFLWQVLSSFMPTVVDLPVPPQAISSLPMVLVSHGQDPANLTELPESDVQKLIKPSVGGKTERRHASKKPKTELKPGSIHLNRVTLAQLDLLPGVGPTLAQRIIDYRNQHGPFQTIEDLKNVKGIGNKKFAKMRIYLAL